MGDLFAGIPVTEFATARAWHEKLFGAAPSFYPNDVEAVWELAPHRYAYIVVRPEHAGHAVNLLFVEDLGERVAGISGRGLAPAVDETYENGVRKVTYRDPDGNEFAFGGGPG